jgi:mRNA interferase RelE/StbE
VKYRVLIDARAAGVLESLDSPLLARIDKAIISLGDNPRPPGCKQLKGKQADGWRIRVGPYRILYRIIDKGCEVRIFDIGHRREVYR